MSIRRVCKRDGCGKEFEVPANAEHKVFCSAECRKAYNYSEIKKGLRVLREKEKNSELSSDLPSGSDGREGENHG